MVIKRPSMGLKEEFTDISFFCSHWWTKELRHIFYLSNFVQIERGRGSEAETLHGPLQVRKNKIDNICSLKYISCFYITKLKFLQNKIEVCKCIYWRTQPDTVCPISTSNLIVLPNSCTIFSILPSPSPPA